MSELLDALAGPAPSPSLRERRTNRLLTALAVELADALAPYFERYNQALVPPIAGQVGWQERLAPPSPAAAANFVYRVPGEEQVKPLSVMARLTCSAVVGTRTLTVEYRDAEGVRFIVAGAHVTLTASQQQSFVWHPEAGTRQWPVDDAAIAPLPSQVLYPTDQLVLKLGGGQAGDQIDQVRIVVHKYATGQ